MTLIVFGGYIQMLFTWIARVWRSRRDEEIAMHYIGLSVVAMGTITSALSLFLNWGGVCIDKLG